MSEGEKSEDETSVSLNFDFVISVGDFGAIFGPFWAMIGGINICEGPKTHFRPSSIISVKKYFHLKSNF